MWLIEQLFVLFFSVMTGLDHWLEKRSRLKAGVCFIIALLALGGFVGMKYIAQELPAQICLYISMLFFFFGVFIFSFSKAEKSLRKLLSFLMFKLFGLSLVLFLLVTTILQVSFTGIYEFPYQLYFTYMAIFTTLWFFSSLLSDSEVAKLSNSLFASIVGTLGAAANVATFFLPETIVFLDYTLDSAELPKYLTIILLPFVFISVTSIALIDTRDYWRRKYPKQAK